MTWTGRFNASQGAISFSVLRATPDDALDMIVETLISREHQEPAMANWRLRLTDGGFRVIDLLVEGTSMAIAYREEFTSVIAQNGGKLQGLLEVLQNKVTQMQPM